MGLLDGLIGGVVGAGAMKVVGDFIDQHGGLQSVVNQLQEKGLGPAVQSWISTGPNRTVTAEELRGALGPEALDRLSRITGQDPQALLALLAEHLPGVVDRLTPDGRMPGQPAGPR